jgi:hypothetical protein
LLFIANFNKGSNNNNGPSVIKKSKTQTIIPNNPSSNVKSKTLVGIASNIVVISTPKKNAEAPIQIQASASSLNSI